MTIDPACKYHPGRKALSFCHGCKEWFCRDCLQEGGEYYYCRNLECRRNQVREEQAPAAPAVPPGGAAEDLATYLNSFEAHPARTKLESEGVEGYALDEYRNQIMPAGGIFDTAFGGVQLKTRKSQAERAFGILKGGGKAAFSTRDWLMTLKTKLGRKSARIFAGLKANRRKISRRRASPLG